MRVYDVTMALSHRTPVYTEHDRLAVTFTARIDRGDPYTASYIAMGSHTGTHVDAPWHFLARGKKLPELGLEAFIGPAYVAEVRGARCVTVRDLQAAGLPPGVRRLLLKTDNSERGPGRAFRQDYSYLDGAAAAWLVRRGVKLVGTDYLSIDPPLGPD